MTLVLAVVAGVVIGLSLGALGGGGSILAVPVLVYTLGQSPAQATTGSLVVVGVTSLVGAVTASRSANTMLGRGLVFGTVAIGGAVAGAKLSVHVSEPLLLAAFSVLMLLVGALMAWRQVSSRRAHLNADDGELRRRARLDDPIITFSPTLACQCPRALKVLVTATGVGLLTGFLGVGGGFLVVPALVLALGLPMELAAGTSLVVITLTSSAALAARAGAGVHPDWGLVLTLTGASAVGGLLGARLACRVETRWLSAAFTVLVLGVAGYTALRALPALAESCGSGLSTQSSHELGDGVAVASPRAQERGGRRAGPVAVPDEEQSRLSTGPRAGGPTGGLAPLGQDLGGRVPATHDGDPGRRRPV